MAFKAPCTIGDLFPFKDTLKKEEDMSQVVYKLKCETCGASYIGKTRALLCKRIYQHKTDNESAVKQHLNTNEGHFFDFTKIEVSDYKLKLKELQHIIKEKPMLDRQLNSQSDYEITTLIIRAHKDLNNTNN